MVHLLNFVAKMFDFFVCRYKTVFAYPLKKPALKAGYETISGPG
jgi:hypothetical protein